MIQEMDVDKSSLLIHFDNWSSKYDEELKASARKIFPLRFYSQGYTGQKKSTLREFDSGLTKKEKIIERMDGYAKIKFACTTQEDIQEMYQFLCGECYLYLDSCITCDEKDAKNDTEGVIEVISSFFEMLKAWLEIVSDYMDYIPYMAKHPYLYLVCPDAAILNLWKSFTTTLELIFGSSARSEEFLRTSSSILKNSTPLPQLKSKKVYLVQAYFMEAFVNTKCLKALTSYIKTIQSDKSSDFSLVLKMLAVISPTFTRIEMEAEDSKTFTSAVNVFLYAEEGITNRIRSLPHSQIKEIDDIEILSVIRSYYEQSGDSLGKEVYCAKTQLDLLLMFLQSPYIDKKLAALNEIKKLFEKKNRSKDVSPKMLAKWLAQCSIIDYIYKEAKHPELISRSAELIHILSENDRLGEETLQLLWDTCITEHKHEAVSEATLNVIASIAKFLNPDQINFFINGIHKLPLTMLGEYINILKTFYLNCLENYRQIYGRSKSEVKMAASVDLNRLWEAIQDDSDVSNKNKMITLDVLIDLMYWFDFTNTSEYLKRPIESLKDGKSSVKCLIMIEKILDNNKRGYPAVYKKEDLINLALHAAQQYLSRARENSPMDGKNIGDMIFSGSISHKETIEKYFHFISYLLKKFDGHNKLTNEHIDSMYEVFVTNSVSKIERDCFFKFFTYDEFDTVNLEDKKVANARNREHLFQNILCKQLKVENTGRCEFKCFESNFFFVNSMKKNLKREMNEQVFRTLSMKLDGLDLVWDFTIFSPYEEIRKECNDFVADLYIYNEKENYKKRGENNMQFFTEWLEKIITIDESNKEAISNSLTLLFSFVKRYDGHHMDNEVFEKYDYDLDVDFHDAPINRSKKTVFKVNKEMTIGAIRKKIGDFYDIIPSEILIVSARSYLSETCMNDKLSAYKECRSINIKRRSKEEREFELPRYLAANNLNVIKQVIEKGLQSENHALRCEALQFFEYIPPNIERRTKMIQCKKLQKGTDDIANWLEFLYCADFKKQGLFYGLKVMKSIIVPFEKDMKVKDLEEFVIQKIQFYKAFNEFDGFMLLYQTLESLTVTEILKDVAWLSIFQTVIDILRRMLEDDDFKKRVPKTNTDSFLKATSKLVLKCTEILVIVSENVSLDRDLNHTLFNQEEMKSLSEDKVKNIKDEYEILETDFFYDTIELLKQCLKLNQSEFEIFYSSDFIKKSTVVNLVAFHPNKNTKEKVAESLVELCTEFRNEDKIKPNPVEFFVEIFNSQLNSILKHDEIKHTEFFNLLDSVIRLSGSKSIDSFD